MAYFLALLLLFPLSAAADEWTQAQLTLGGLGLTLLAIDSQQSHYISRHYPDLKEANPLLGSPRATSGQIDRYYAAVPLLSFLALNALPSEYRTGALLAVDAAELWVVNRNFRFGVHVRW